MPQVTTSKYQAGIIYQNLGTFTDYAFLRPFGRSIGNSIFALDPLSLARPHLSHLSFIRHGAYLVAPEFCPANYVVLTCAPLPKRS